jgi:serine/threonine protein kinase
VLFADDEMCLECRVARPSQGWPELGRTTDPWLGRTLADRYLLTRRIGQGASGNVYRAESLTISRQFAVKIIPLDNADTSVKAEHIEARLNREISALGHLRNPHIVSFYDVVPIGERAVALLMDLIDGQTLEELVATGGPMDMVRACKVLRQIANGVHEAHEAGMIHRDLKPENVMIERLPAGDDFVHILDFGIVWREGDVRVTQGFLGTPLYASPEQAVGGQLDRRADIYALGGVFFFMLTGRPPFFDNNVYNVLKAHVSTQPPRLAEVATNRQFPEALEALVRKMLAKSPNDRPQSLSGVIYTLDELVVALSEAGNTGADKVSDSVELPPATDELSGTDDRSEANRTVQSEASLVEASKPEAKPLGGRDSGFFRSDEWDSTGPKAAIFRGRTPTNPVPAIGRNSKSATESSEADAVASGSDFDRRAKLRRDSGLYEMPRLAAQLPNGGLRCAAARSQELLVVDADYQVHVGQPDAGFSTEFSMPAKPELTALSLGRDTIYTGHADGTLLEWSIADATSQRLHQNASTSAITSVDCDSDGRWLLFGTEAGGLYLAERHDDQLQPLRIQSGPGVRAVALSASRNMFAVARADGSIGVFNISSPTSLVHRFSADDRVEQMSFSQDGYLLAVVFADKKLALYHVMTGKLFMRKDRLLEQPLSVSFNDNNQLVGYCEVEGSIFGWDLHRNLVAHQQK